MPAENSNIMQNKMKMTYLPALIVALVLFAPGLVAGDKQAGEKCIADTQCAFQLKCNDGVCVKKKEFDFGGSGKTGKRCNIDADCIGSGECVKGNFGKKYCSGR